MDKVFTHFSLVRYPDVSYLSEVEVMKASEELDAVFETDKSIEERLPDGTTNLVSVRELRIRLSEAEIENEVDEESVPPEAVIEGTEEEE